MKGDLHTLKRVCEYASKVMLAGTIILAAAMAVALVLGIASAFSDTAGNLLRNIFGLSPLSGSDNAAPLLELLAILLLGTATVFTISRIMVSIMNEHSPFNDANTSRLIDLSKLYLVGAFAIGLLSGISGNGLTATAFLFFGCILIAVVLYCFGLVIRYGAVLQDESDHTL